MVKHAPPKKAYKDLPLVPETILKKRHDLDDLRRKKAAAQLEKQQRQATITRNSKTKGTNKQGKAGNYVTKLETLIAQGRSRRHTTIRYNRVLKKGMQTRASKSKVMTTKAIEDRDDDDDDDAVDATKTTTTTTYQSNSVGADMVFVIRVRDHHGASSMVKKALSRLRLRNINEGVFVKYDASHQKLLHLVEPWVVYGPPTKGVVEDLIERRGFGKLDGKRVPLSDNTVIEQAFASDDNGTSILCAEDLVHELCHAGDAFAPVSKFLWPFRLSHTTSHFERETLKVKLGKEYGDKGDAINDFIKQML